MTSNLTQLQQGELLQKAAYAQPPIAHLTGLAQVLVAILATVLALTTVVVALRIYVKAWMKQSVWLWDDTFAVLGFGAYFCTTIFTIESARYGLGFRDSSLTPLLKIRSFEYLLYAEILYSVSSPLIKASAVCTLVRITPRHIGLEVHRWILYFMLLLATVMAIVATTMTLLYCHPIKAWWNPLLGTCSDFMRVVRTGYAWTAVSIITDCTCAILPYLIIRKMRLPRKTKIVVIFILGLGALASVASIGRAPYLKYYHVPVDQQYWNGFILLLSSLECGIGLISVCLPSLRQLVVHNLENGRTGHPVKGGSSSNSGPLGGVNADMIPLSASDRALAGTRGWSAMDDQELGFSTDCAKVDTEDDLKEHKSGSAKSNHITQETTVSVVVGNRDEFRHV